jgi:CRP/FNR family transcriptional regulator
MNFPEPLPDPHHLAARLHQVEHFRRLSTNEVEAVIALGVIRTYAKNAVIFVENEADTGLYVLLSGQVQLIKLSAEGQIAILAVFDPVIMFNEVSALDNSTTPATTIATEDTLAWRLAPDHLERLILTYPTIGLGLLRVMANRNRRLVSHFEDLSFRSVLSRTAKLLLEISERGTRRIDRRRFPNHQLAARIATIPEAFSRSLKVFRNNGDIHCDYHEICVDNPDHLALVAQLGPAEKASATDF